MKRLILALSLLLIIPLATAHPPPGPPVGIQDEGGAVGYPAGIFDCVGDGIACSQSGQTATITVAGDGGLTWEVISGNDTAVSGEGFLINASGGNITLTLPATPSEGDVVGVCDFYDKATTNTITVARNGSNIEATAGDLVIDIDGAGFTMTYSDATRGWEITSEIGYRSANKMIYGALGLDAAYDRNTNYVIVELDSTVFPSGIVITGWEIESTNADPTTELDANLTYCDDNTTGAFPGANPVLVDVLDTTTGNSSESDMSNSDLTSGVIPVDKILYIDMDADPVDTDNYFVIKIEYYLG